MFFMLKIFAIEFENPWCTGMRLYILTSADTFHASLKPGTLQHHVLTPWHDIQNLWHDNELNFTEILLWNVKTTKLFKQG